MHSSGRRELLIVWHSRTGASEQLSQQVALGAESALSAESAGTDATATAAPVVAASHRRLRCDEAQAADLLTASAYVFVCPENLASMAGAMKEFFDRCYYPVLDQINGRPYAQIVAAGSDGQGAVRQIARIATGWRLRAVAEPIIAMMHAQTPQSILAAKVISARDAQRAFDLGALLAYGLVAGIW